MARLAALVPPRRMHLTRYRGVFAPHSRLRAAGAEQRATPRHEAMSWAHLDRIAGTPEREVESMPLGARAPPSQWALL